MKEKFCEWFVQPLNDATNEIIAKYLLASGNLDENIMRDMPTIEGPKVNVIRVRAYSDISYFNKSALSLGLKFKIFNRKTPRGLLCEIFFIKRKNKTIANKNSEVKAPVA